jgi:DNA-binding MarR family transcriptional regulator
MNESKQTTSNLPTVGEPNDYELVSGVLRLACELRGRLGEELASCDLNDTRFALLRGIAAAGKEGCSQTELAQRLQHSESNVSTLLDRMDKNGLVRRSRSETDRRKTVIQLSSAGEKLLARGEAAYIQFASEILTEVGHSERDQLSQQLGDLCTSLSRAA